MDPNCNSDTQTVAEIVVATDDDMYLAYSNSENGSVGLIDISDPSNPMPAGEVSVGVRQHLLLFVEVLFLLVSTPAKITLTRLGRSRPLTYRRRQFSILPGTSEVNLMLLVQ